MGGILPRCAVGRDVMIVAGFGCRKEASLESLLSALRGADASHRIECLATTTDLAGLCVFQALSQELGLEVRSCSDKLLSKQLTVTQSEVSQKYKKMGSVAEAAALAVAGPNSRLLTLRFISDDRMATCAVAKGAEI